MIKIRVFSIFLKGRLVNFGPKLTRNSAKLRQKNRSNRLRDILAQCKLGFNQDINAPNSTFKSIHK